MKSLNARDDHRPLLSGSPEEGTAAIPPAFEFASQDDYLRFLSTLPGSSVHIWCPTRLRSMQLRMACAGARCFKIDTFADALNSLTRFLFSLEEDLARNAGRLRIVSDAERLSLLYQILRERSREYPLLSRFVAFSPGHSLFPENLLGLAEVLDLLRLNRATDTALSATIDEYGNVREAKARNEELLLLLGDYQEKLRNLGRQSSGKALVCDRVGLLEHLLSLLEQVALNEGREVLASSYGHVVLDQPTAFYSLEYEILSRVAALTQVTVVLDEAVFHPSFEGEEGGKEPVPVTLRYLATLRRFFRETGQLFRVMVPLKNALPLRERVVAGALDLDMVTLSNEERRALREGLTVWSSANRREEVRRVAARIEELLREGTRCRDIQVVLFDLDSYEELLREAFRVVGIRATIPRGKRLVGTLPAGSLLSALRWLTRPSLRSAAEFFGGLSRRAREVRSEEYSRFLRAYAEPVTTVMKSLAFTSVRGADHELSFSSGKYLDPGRLVDLAVQFGVATDGADDWIGALLASFVVHFRKLSARVMREGSSPQLTNRISEEVEKFEDALHQLSGLYTELEAARRVVAEEKPGRLITALRRYFMAGERPVQELRRQHTRLPRYSLEEYVRARRAVRQVLQEVSKTLDFVSRHSPELVQRNDVLEMIGKVLSSRIAQVSLREPVLDESIVVTELLDGRTAHDRIVFLLGATVDAFPAGGGSAMAASVFEMTARHLSEAGGRLGGSVESFFLVGHLIRQSRSCVVSFPREVVSAELEPATFALDLARLLGELEEGREGPESAADEGVLPREAERALRAIRARSTPAPSTYQGAVPEELLDLLADNLPGSIRSHGENRYTTSVLERLADCRHQFFFEDVLRLRTKDTSFVNRIKREAGNVVHAALKRFFEESPELDTTAGFRRACARLAEIARELFEGSDLDWECHPAARSMRDHILLGLDASQEGGKRGILRAMLDYERDFIETSPVCLEYGFGLGENGALPLRLQTEKGDTLVCGRIDRIDGRVASDGRISAVAVWDYKIRSVPKFKDVEAGKSLQIPLYAAAIAANPTIFTGPPARGGCIVLADTNRTDPDVTSITKGVIIEHLAVGKSGKDFVLDTEQTAGRIRKATDRVLELDTLVRNGNFLQQSETKACPYCKFSRICGRNDFLIELREAGRNEILAPVVRRRTTLWRDPFRLDEESLTALAHTTLSLEQELACDVTRDVALLAGAGSGKTTVLWNRIVRLVLAGESIERIVAITFTEKAAREIRSRLEGAIGALLRAGHYGKRELSRTERERLHSARLSLPRSPIGTIHSFARRILALDEVLAEGLATARVVTGPEQLVLLNRAADEALFGRVALSKLGLSGEDVATVVERLLAAGIPFQALRAQVIDLMRRPRFLEEMRRVYSVRRQPNGRLLAPEAEEEMLRRFREEHRRYTARVRGTLCEFLSNWLPAFERWMEDRAPNLLEPTAMVRYKKVLDDVKELDELLKSAGGEVSGWGRVLEKLFAYLGENSRFAKRASPKANPRNFWKELRETISATKPEFLRDSFDREGTGLELAASLVTIALAAEECYRSEKRLLSVVDFEDLILLAYRMVCEPLSGALGERQQELRARLPQLFRHIMVDEFQDTDGLQWKLITACIVEAPNGQPVGTRFIVGDSQQAIYGFRGGDVRTLQQATRELGKQGVELTLTGNYRSNEEIIRFLNGLFQRLFAYEFERDGSPKLGVASSGPPLRAMRFAPTSLKTKSCFPAVSLLITRRKQGSERRWEIHEAERVAELIHMVVNGRKGDDSLRRVLERPRSLAVLTRSVRELLTVADALRGCGVSFSISHSSGFYDLEEIKAIENFLRALASPGDQIALVGALRSPLFGFDDGDLIRLFGALKGQWEMFWCCEATSAGDDIIRAQRRFIHYRILAGVARASDIVSRVADESGLFAAYRAALHDEAYRNVERLIDAMREAELRGEIERGVLDAARWIDIQRAEGLSAPNANRTDEPVVLMTIHGAKGLEFPFVVVPFLRRRTTGGQRDFLRGEVRLGDGDIPLPLLSVRVEDEGMDYRRCATFIEHAVLDEVRAITASEERRIFYVACTRARDHLVLSFSEPSDPESRWKEVAGETPEIMSEKIFRSDNAYEWLIRLFEPGQDGWRFRGEADVVLPLLTEFPFTCGDKPSLHREFM